MEKIKISIPIDIKKSWNIYPLTDTCFIIEKNTRKCNAEVIFYDEESDGRLFGYLFFIIKKNLKDEEKVTCLIHEKTHFIDLFSQQIIKSERSGLLTKKEGDKQREELAKRMEWLFILFISKYPPFLRGINTVSDMINTRIKKLKGFCLD